MRCGELNSLTPVARCRILMDSAFVMDLSTVSTDNLDDVDIPDVYCSGNCDSRNSRVRINLKLRFDLGGTKD